MGLDVKAPVPSAWRESSWKFAGFAPVVTKLRKIVSPGKKPVPAIVTAAPAATGFGRTVTLTFPAVVVGLTVAVFVALTVGVALAVVVALVVVVDVGLLVAVLVPVAVWVIVLEAAALLRDSSAALVSVGLPDVLRPAGTRKNKAKKTGSIRHESARRVPDM